MLGHLTYSYSPVPLPDKCEGIHCEGIHSWGEAPVGQIPLSPSDEMIIVMVMTGRGDLQFHMGSKPWWGPAILHITKSVPYLRWGKRFWHEEKSSLNLAGIELMRLSTGGQYLTPRPSSSSFSCCVMLVLLVSLYCIFSNGKFWCFDVNIACFCLQCLQSRQRQCLRVYVV